MKDDVRMTYRTRKGIVLLHVCGSDLLAATREAWEECPRIRPVPKIWAVVWKLMEQGKTSQEIVETFQSMLNRPETEVRERFDRIFEAMSEEGYLIQETERP